VDQKQCSICGKLKSLTEFYSQKKYSKKRGEYFYYNPECRECTKREASLGKRIIQKIERNHYIDITPLKKEENIFMNMAKNIVMMVDTENGKGKMQKR